MKNYSTKLQKDTNSIRKQNLAALLSSEKSNHKNYDQFHKLNCNINTFISNIINNIYFHLTYLT